MKYARDLRCFVEMINYDKGSVVRTSGFGELPIALSNQGVDMW